MNGTAHISCIKYKNLNNISHYHSDHELVYINKGQATITINENTFNLKSKDCVFIYSNDIHYIQSDESTFITVLKAKSKHFENIFTSKKLLSPIIKENRNTERILDNIRSELTLYHDNSDIMADSIATQLFIEVLRSEKTSMCKSEFYNKQATNQLYNEICKKIFNEYRTITFKDAAKHMHLSEPYFSKVFRNISGMTFTQYLNTVRIAAAIERLKQGNVSITAISADCGFNTIRNFNRVFKKFTGYSPNSLPSNYVFLYSLREGYGLDPTLNCTEILE